MSGVATHRLGEGKGGGGGGGSGGTLGPLSWNNIVTSSGVTQGSTNTQTISGITGSLGLEASTGVAGVSITPVLNGSPGTAGASVTVAVVAGNTLAWILSNVTGVLKSGTCTLTRTDTSATVDTFSFSIHGSTA